MSKRDFDPIKKAEAYLYRAKVLRVVDGDTVELQINMGFDIFCKQTFRLYSINAPEMKGEEKEKGKEAKAFLESMIKGKDILVRTYYDKKGTFRRYLAYIYSYDDKICINDEMVKHGHAEKYREEI